ncbi:MAG: exodeoxyribonuclease VII small subunit [Rhodospirillales bacterium]|nr:exodeoxyribonuclease VII small subunit [Rhodospirillales bacterium]
MTETARPEAGNDVSFEEALAELRAIVERLESGESRLDEAIAAYEKGAKLKQLCEAKLRAAQLMVERIALGKDGPSAVPFDGKS